MMAALWEAYAKGVVMQNPSSLYHLEPHLLSTPHLTMEVRALRLAVKFSIQVTYDALHSAWHIISTQCYYSCSKASFGPRLHRAHCF